MEPAPSVIDFVRSHRWAVLATQTKSGAPHLTLVTYALEGDKVLILTPGSTLKARNIRRRPEVSLAIVDGREQAIIYGEASFIEDVDEVTRIVPMLREFPPAAETIEKRRAWVESQSRVIVVVSPTSYYPKTMTR